MLERIYLKGLLLFLVIFLSSISFAQITEGVGTKTWYAVEGDNATEIQWVNITPDTPYSNQSLNCTFAQIDENNATVFWNATWYFNNTINDTWDTGTLSVANNTVIGTPIAPIDDDTEEGDVIICSITTWDDEGGFDSLNASETVLTPEAPAEPPGGGGGGGRIIILPYCGNDLCESNDTYIEDFFNCPEDCPATGIIEELLRRLGEICGNAVCGPGETSLNCPQDCLITCGNGICESGEIITCPADCEVKDVLFSVDLTTTREIDLYYNVTKSSIIEINNDGNKPLTNVRIEKESLGNFYFDIYPHIIPIIYPGETAFFFVNMKTLIPDDFTYKIIIASSEKSSEEILNIHVIKKIPPLRSVLVEEYENLELMYEYLIEKTDNKENQGYDVRSIKLKLSDARFVLDNIDSCLKRDDIGGCNQTLTDVRFILLAIVEDLGYLERVSGAVITISKLFSEYISWLLIGAIVVAVILLRWYTLLPPKVEREYKKEYELLKKKYKQKLLEFRNLAHSFAKPDRDRVLRRVEGYKRVSHLFTVELLKSRIESLEKTIDKYRKERSKPKKKRKSKKRKKKRSR